MYPPSHPCSNYCPPIQLPTTPCENKRWNRTHPIIAYTRISNWRIRVERGQRRGEGKKFKVRFDARTPFAWHDFTEHLSKESRKSPPPPSSSSCPSPRERSRLLEISTATKYRDTLTRGGMYAFEKAKRSYSLYKGQLILSLWGYSHPESQFQEIEFIAITGTLNLPVSFENRDWEGTNGTVVKLFGVKYWCIYIRYHDQDQNWRTRISIKFTYSLAVN